jgi:hypothetical protein
MRHYVIVFFIIAGVMMFPQVCNAADDHLKDIDDVRSSMTAMGYKLPDAIRATKAENIRTLERVFEINNYALVTIESYLKMLKIFSLSDVRNDKKVLPIINGWLTFISHYCESDIKYLEEAQKEMAGDNERKIVGEQKDNISRLMKAARRGIDENSNAFGR